MKKIYRIFLILVVLLASSGFTNINAQSESPDISTIVEKINQEYKDDYYAMTADQINLELQRISQEYINPGEILNERDSAIIILDRYEAALRPTLKAGVSSKWYDVYKTQYGVKVNLYGTMRQNIAFIGGSSTYGGTATLNVVSGSVKNVSISIHHTAYGLVGTSAPFVGVLYNGSVSMSKSGNNKYTKMDKNGEYGSILPVYTTMYASATITNSSGDEFDVYGETWTSWH